MKIIGIERVDYTNKAGIAVKGYRIHGFNPMNAKYGQGYSCVSLYANDKCFASPPALNDEVDVLYGVTRDGRAYIREIRRVK